MSYEQRITDFDTALVRIEGGREVHIPQDHSNRDYLDYLAWTTAGGVATVVDLRPTQQQRERGAALPEIERLERTQSRAVREIALGRGDVADGQGLTPRQRLQAIDDAIAAQRARIV